MCSWWGLTGGDGEHVHAQDLTRHQFSREQAKKTAQALADKSAAAAAAIAAHRAKGAPEPPVCVSDGSGGGARAQLLLFALGQPKAKPYLELNKQHYTKVLSTSSKAPCISTHETCLSVRSERAHAVHATYQPALRSIAHRPKCTVCIQQVLRSRRATKLTPTTRPSPAPGPIPTAAARHVRAAAARRRGF